MRAVVCNAFAPLDQLVVVERDAPPIRPGSVRVQIRAAGVNFVDALIVQGLYQIKPPVPFTPGGEAVGIVTELGDGVTSLEQGDRVLVTTGAGAFATEVVVPERATLKVPESMSDGQAATFMQSYGTAYFALVRRAAMQAGQSLLVLGAGGGVGLGAVDVGQALGLHVIAAASTQDKRDLAVAHGAAATIDSGSEDVKARAKELSPSGDGVDAVYDPIGGTVGEQCLRALRDDGQFLVIGFASGAIPSLPANQVLLRNRRVTGVEWGGWVAKHPEENAQMVAEVLQMIVDGRLHPVEPTGYRFEDAAQALADQQNRKVTGKAVLVMEADR